MEGDWWGLKCEERDGVDGGRGMVVVVVVEV